MKFLKFSLLSIAAISALSVPAHADWWGWHRHPGPVVIAPGPGFVVDVGYHHDYYRMHHHSLEVDVQLALSRLGYYHGPIDGDIGPGSSAAISNYQYNTGLRPTGTIDGQLIRSLGL